MPKVSKTAQIHLRLLKSRAKANRKYPIYLVVNFNGKTARRYANADCSIAEWNIKEERVNPKAASANLINASLLKMKSDLIDLRDRYEQTNEAYTAASLLADGCNPDVLGKTPNFKQVNECQLQALLNDIFSKKSYTYNTKHSFVYALNLISRYLKRDLSEIYLRQLDEVFCKQFCEWLRNCITRETFSTIQMVMVKISILWHHARQYGYSGINFDKYPFSHFKFRQKYKTSTTKVALTKNEINQLEDYFLDKFTKKVGNDENTGNPRRKVIDYNKLQNTASMEFAIAAYILSFRFYGMAPCDLANLKVGNLSKESSAKNIKEEYIVITNARRQKTNKSIPTLHVPYTGAIQPIYDCFHKFARQRDDYFLPVYQSVSSDEKNTEERKAIILNRVETKINIKLRDLFQHGDLKFFQGEPIPTDNEKVTLRSGRYEHKKKITIYTARHTFASVAVSSNYSHFIIAQVMGRNPNNIETYVHSLEDGSFSMKMAKDIYGR